MTSPSSFDDLVIEGASAPLSGWRANRLPARLAATESWPPNAELARHRLRRFGVAVSEVADEARLPFDDGLFGLTVSRHPVVTQWAEISRVLRPGGTFLSQQVGAGSNRQRCMSRSRQAARSPVTRVAS